MSNSSSTKKRVLAQGQAPGQDPLAFLANMGQQVEVLTKSVVDLNQGLISIPPAQLSPTAVSQDPQSQLTILQQQLGEVEKIKMNGQELTNQVSQLQATIDRLMTVIQGTVNNTMNNMSQASQTNTGPTGPSGPSGPGGGAMASRVFNLKKTAQKLEEGMGGFPIGTDNVSDIPDVNLGITPDEDVVEDVSLDETPRLKDSPEDTGITMSGLNWQTAADLMRFLNKSKMDREKAEKILMQLVSDDEKEGITSLLEEYYEGDLLEEEKLEVAIRIWPMLPDLVRADSPRVEENIMPLSNIQSFVNELVKDADMEIRKLAQTTSVSKTSKSVFNLTKTAQHKSMDNVILYGPDQTYMDEFTRQPASKWSLIERNKGFGLVVDDVWDIDFESIWRGNIMDKYSRPYRNDDGEYVGGYIQKRFEVDKWMPEGNNNYQLKPGERRREYIPEQRSLEARMVAQRSGGDAPYESDDQSKPFNWKEASTKKKS